MAAAPVVTFALATRPPRPAVMTQTEMTRLLTEAAKQQGHAVGGLRGEARYSLSSLARVPRQPLLSRVWDALRQAWRSVQGRLPAAAVGWMLGVLLLSLRLLARWGLLVRSKRRGLPLREARWQEALVSLSHRLGVKRTVQVLQSALVAVPTVFGWLRPVILLPPAAVLGLTPEQLEAVLAHELAHIRRHDFLVNLCQAVVETLLFYHPAAWWLSRRLRVEREHCCDDLAAAACGDLLTYASGLAALEAARARHWEPALAASGGSLLLRLRRLAGAQSPLARGGLASWLNAALPLLALALLAATPSLASIAGAPYIRGTVMYQESPSQVRGSYWEMWGDVARAMSGRSDWAVKDPSPFHLVEYSPNGDEALTPQGPTTQWTRAYYQITPSGEVGHCTPGLTHIWKVQVDRLGRPDFSRAVDLIDRAGIGGDNGTPRWSPDGGRFLFLHGDGCSKLDGVSYDPELWVMSADGRGAHEIRIPGRTYVYGAQWMPDGSWVLLSTRAAKREGDVSCGSASCAAMLADVDNARIRQLPVRYGTVSPDGRWIAGVQINLPHGVTPQNKGEGWYKPSTGTYRWKLLLLHPEGTGERTLLTGSCPLADLPADPCATAVALTPHDFTWSPDSRQIAFVCAMDWDRSGPPINRQVELFIYDLPSGRLTQMTDDDLEQCTPVWME